jgi:hypothetical protein
LIGGIVIVSKGEDLGIKSCLWPENYRQRGRPLHQQPRQTDPEKVNQLMQSIAEEGLREPIDVLEVDGKYYGFSGCHRFAAHRKFGSETPSFYDGFAVKYEHRLRNIC